MTPCAAKFRKAPFSSSPFATSGADVSQTHVILCQDNGCKNKWRLGVIQRLRNHPFSSLLNSRYGSFLFEYGITLTAILYKFNWDTFCKRSPKVCITRITEDVLVVKSLKWVHSTELASLLIFNIKVFIMPRAADIRDYQILFSFTIKLSKLTIYKRTL